MTPDRAGAELPAVDVVWRARALVFDFDGTLVDSNPIKWRAFEGCFEEFPEYRKRILEYCHAHDHTPRGEKFRHVYETILGRPYTADTEAMLHRRFEAATTAQIAAAPAIAGAEEMLALAGARCGTALLSSTPQGALEQIVGARGWARYFEVVRGAPVDKASWLKQFRHDRDLGGDAVVVFGDSPEDAAAAGEAGCAFIGVRNPALRGRVRYWIDDYTGVRDLAAT